MIVIPLAAGAAADPAPTPSHLYILRTLTDDEIILPGEWAGIWESTENTYDCVADSLIETWVGHDTLCTGDLILDPEEMPIECTMEFDGSTLSYDCTGTVEIIGECSAEYHLFGTWTVDGETLTSEFTFSIEYSAGCDPGFPDICNRTEVTATKIGPEPPECEDTWVSMTRWGAIKALYR
jgi:hypothetical protein